MFVKFLAMKTDVTTSIILDTRRKRKDFLFPIKLRITFDRYSRYYSLHHALNNVDFEKVMGKAPREELKSIKRNILDEENRARDIIERLNNFSFEKFNQEFLKKKYSNSDISVLIQKKVDQLKNEERIKSAWSYQSLQSSLIKFKDGRQLHISKINVPFLKEYENWMLASGKSNTTVGIYLRNLRVIINEAIESKLFDRDQYPFGRRKYQIPTGRNVKKALLKETLLKIADYQPKNRMESYCRDIWLFSYLANGMNIADIANLKYKDLSDNFLSFIRQKTKNSARQSLKVIIIYLNDKILEIIKKWGNAKSEEFIFPIFKPGMRTIDKIRKVDSTIQSINHHIDKIAKALGIEKKVTTYTARHTFSTVLKRSGASIEFISESLGHQNISTTRHYLDSFENEEKRKWSEKLL